MIYCNFGFVTEQLAHWLTSFCKIMGDTKYPNCILYKRDALIKLGCNFGCLLFIYFFIFIFLLGGAIAGAFFCDCIFNLQQNLLELGKFTFIYKYYKSKH